MTDDDIGSLKERLAVTSDQRKRIDLLYRLSWLLSTSNPGEATQCAEEGLQLAHAIDDQFRIAQGMGYVGRSLATMFQDRLMIIEQEKRIVEMQSRLDKADTQREQEALRLHSEQLEHQLQVKQQEFAAQVMHLARQTELLGRFRNELRAIVRQADRAETAIKAIKQKLQELPCESIDWTKFDAEFQQTYPEFRDTLVAAYPELTKMELKVASLLKLKLQTPDISRLLCISERTVEGHRRSLRKVFGLHSKQSLTKFLVDF